MLIKDRNTFNTKWVCDFASQLIERGFKVVLVSDSYNKSGDKQPVNINPLVKKINLSQKSANRFYNLYLQLRSFFPFANLRYKSLFKKENPDIIICYFNHDLINSTFLQNHQIPIIMMMHNPPNEIFANTRCGYKKFITDMAFKRANVVQVLMHSFKQEITNIYPDKKVAVIANQVLPPAIQQDLSITHNKIIHVAQIARDFKRQHLLIEAFSLIASDFPDWQVNFFGRVKKGKHAKYYQELLAKVKDLGLENQIFFKGYSNDITSEYLNSDIVTMPSYSEGFGYGLADGLALGLVGVGFRDAPAINELIIDNQTGYLVTDIKDYADKLSTLMKDKDLRIKLGKNAQLDMQRYAPKIIIDSWIELINSTIQGNK